MAETETLFGTLIEYVGMGIDLAGVVVMIGGILASVVAFRRRLKQDAFPEAYAAFRKYIAQTILLSLELLIAGDIVRSIAITPTFTSVGVLAAIIAVRSFLSFELEVEITKMLPWRRNASAR